MPRERRRLKSAINAIGAATTRRALREIVIDLDGITAANKRRPENEESALARLVRRIRSQDRSRNE